MVHGKGVYSRECMVCEKLCMNPEDESYFCECNGEVVDVYMVENFMCPAWCPDLAVQYRSACAFSIEAQVPQS